VGGEAGEQFMYKMQQNFLKKIKHTDTVNLHSWYPKTSSLPGHINSLLTLRQLVYTCTPGLQLQLYCSIFIRTNHESAALMSSTIFITTQSLHTVWEEISNRKTNNNSTGDYFSTGLKCTGISQSYREK